MKKLFALVFVLTALMSTTSFAKLPDPTDFFAGKWKIMVLATPNGDATFSTDLVRKDGALTGVLKVVGDAAAESQVYFGGRLGEYKYYDMHQIIERALSMVETFTS